MEPLHQTLTSVGESDSEFVSREIHLRLRVEALLLARRHQRLLSQLVQSPMQITTNFTGEVTNAADGQGEEERQNQEIDEGIVESGKRKRKSDHLIAKALGVEEPDATGKAAEEESKGKFFNCSICLEMAKDPVLTCCGHLFCWPCFYQVSYAYLKVRECPVCKGEVAESGIIPIYGNGDGGDDRELELKEAGLTVPPRPRAPRVESIRQQLISHEASSIFPNVWRFSTGRNVGLGEQVGLGTPNTTTDRNNVQLTQSRPLPDNNQQTDSHPVQGDSSFSSVSSALHSTMNSTERLFQDLESYIRSHQTGGSNPRTESLITPDIAVTNSAAAGSVSPMSRNVDNIATIGSEIPRISMFYPSSSNGIRRNDLSAPQPESLTPDFAVSTSSASAASVSPLRRNLDNIAAMISEIHPSSNSRRRNDLSVPQPESLTPDVAVSTNSASAASVSPLRRNLDNIAAMISEIQTTDSDARISMFYPSSSNGRRRNDVSRPQPESLTPDVAVTNSASAASVSPLSRNLDNIATMISEIRTTDSNARISMLYPSSSNCRRRNDVSRPQPESLTPDVAVTNSAAAGSMSPLSSNVDNIAAIVSEIQTPDNIPQISMFYPSSSGRRRNDVSRHVPDEPRTRRRLR